MRPLERRPGNDPGLPDCAAWVCPLHSARMDGLVRPGTPTGSRHLLEDRGGRNRTVLLEARENPSAPPVKCPKDRHVLAPDMRPRAALRTRRL